MGNPHENKRQITQAWQSHKNAANLQRIAIPALLQLPASRGRNQADLKYKTGESVKKRSQKAMDSWGKAEAQGDGGGKS